MRGWCSFIKPPVSVAFLFIILHVLKIFINTVDMMDMMDTARKKNFYIYDY